MRGLPGDGDLTSGARIVKDGEEEDFLREWTDFVSWACGFAGSGTFRLVRDLDHHPAYMSFAPWNSFDAQQAWNGRSSASGSCVFAATARTFGPPPTSSSPRLE